MAATDNTSMALTGSSEESTLAKMFKSVLTEIKELKETVAPLVEPAYEDERDDNLEQGDDESTTAGVDKRPADDPGNKPTEKASGSKLLAEIVRELDISEKTGDEVDEGLVKLMDGLLKDKLQEDKVQTRIEKYPRPGNVEGLRTPRVNPLIWNQIPAQVRTSDSKSQKSQNALVASIVAMIKATNLVLEQEDEHATAKDKAVVSTLTDVITLAMQCFHDMNSSRRQAMKKDLHRDYAALCTSSTIPPTSEYLFGDLSKLTKDISDANKLAKKVRPQQARAHNRKYSTSSQRNQGNRRYQPYQRPRTDFLSKGRLPRSKFKKEGDTKQT
ncbi:uncharacterized protein [Montipora capricornis]|uniref:uncharacterized protein n=1 Tax=Montipora capricornis TaxID=246305 RepID=UPI0035F1BB87